MPDDTQNTPAHDFDREPSTGAQQSRPDTTEHADLQHRIDADTHTQDAPVTSFTPSPAPQGPAASQAAPAVAAPAPVAQSLPKAGPGLMVLQWLVYAFWGWTVLALSVLVGMVVSNLIDEGGSSDWYGGGIAYVLAAVIVLFIISIICDVFYSRSERNHGRSTGTNVIMIIHAVLFALFGIGSLIMAVFGGVQLMIGEESDTSGPVTAIVSGLIIALIYGATLLRTLRPKWLAKVAPLFWGFMSVVIIVTVIMAIAGPVAQARLQAQDEIIEDGLPGVADAINSYAEANGKLPATLEDAKGSVESYGREEVEKLIDADLVKYTPGDSLAQKNVSSNQPDLRVIQKSLGIDAIYTYELCVEYKARDDVNYGNSDMSVGPDGNFPTYVSTYGHEAGEVCYDLQTDTDYAR